MARKPAPTLNDKICPVHEIVDLRLQGLTFDELTEKYNTTKMSVYWYYGKILKERNYDGYEPIPIEEVRKFLNRNLSLPKIAEMLGVPVRGLKNYLADREIYRLPTKAKVEKMLREKNSLKSIAAYYGLSYGKFRKWVRENLPECDTKEGRKRLQQCEKASDT